jgi:hypothetical protein
LDSLEDLLENRIAQDLFASRACRRIITALREYFFHSRRSFSSRARYLAAFFLRLTMFYIKSSSMGVDSPHVKIRELKRLVELLASPHNISEAQCIRIREYLGHYCISLVSEFEVQKIDQGLRDLRLRNRRKKTDSDVMVNLNDDEDSSLTRLWCANCDKPAKFVCSNCRRQYYCSFKCQKDDWVSHRADCEKKYI